MRGLLATIALIALAFGAGAEEAEPVAEEDAQPQPGGFICYGNEPFWSLTIDGDRAAYRTLDHLDAPLRGRLSALDWAEPRISVYRGRGDDDDRDLVAVLREQRCQDTMADEEFPYDALLALQDGTIVLGCCEPGEARADWSRELSALVPAILACLEGIDDALVTVAWPIDEERTGVRLRLSDGARLECVHEAETASIEPLDLDAELLPGEGDPLLVPGDSEEPEGECVRADRVELDDLAGWLVYDACN